MSKIASPSPNRVISVGGGKGGVGKSILSANLAVAIAQTGRRTVLVDLDLGAANQHLLLGVASCRPGVRPLIEGSAADVQEALTPTAIPNLSLLAGTGAVFGAANITYNAKLRLLRKLRSLDAVVILDVGAGVGYNALDFFLLGGQKLLVTTPQVTAIHDAYSFLKGTVLRLLQQQAERSIEAALLEPLLLSAESAKVSVMMERLREQRPEFAEKVAKLLQTFNGYLVGNQVNHLADSKVLPSVAKMMQEFLGIEVPILGWVPTGTSVSDSVNDRRPFVLGRASEQGRVVRQIADALMADDVTDELDLDIAIEEDLPVAPLVVVPAGPPPTPRGSRNAPVVLAAAPAPNTTPPPRAGAKAAPTGSRRVVPLERVAAATAGGGKGGRRRPLTLPGMTPFPPSRSHH